MLAHRGQHLATCKLSRVAGGRGGGGRLKEEEGEEGIRKGREGCREVPPMLTAQSGEEEQRSSVAIRSAVFMSGATLLARCLQGGG